MSSDQGDNPRRKLWMGVYAGTHRRTAQRKLAKPSLDSMDALHPQFNLTGVAGKLLTKCDRDRVLQVRPANFFYVCKSGCSFGERLVQQLQRGQQPGAQGNQGCEMKGRGDNVIARLALVDVIIGMNR